VFSHTFLLTSNKHLSSLAEGFAGGGEDTRRCGSCEDDGLVINKPGGGVQGEGNEERGGAVMNSAGKRYRIMIIVDVVVGCR
jgi:hypothetical protein